MEKILVGFASFASLAAIGTVLVVVPYMYNAINAVHDEVMDSIQVCLPIGLHLVLVDLPRGDRCGLEGDDGHASDAHPSWQAP